MWIFTKEGFYSVVQHKDGATKMLVRSRTRGDLERFCVATGLSEKRVKCDVLADYRWRMEAPRDIVTRYVRDAANGINYTTSVKDHLDLDDGLRHSAMMGVWSSMMRLQETRVYPQYRDDADATSVWGSRWGAMPALDDPDEAMLAELDDETSWFLGEEALDEIRDMLDGQAWGEHTLDAIADIIRNTGREVVRAE